MRTILISALVASFLLLAPHARADTLDYAGAGSSSGGTVSITGSLKPGSTWSIIEPLIGIMDLTTGKMQSGVLGLIQMSTGVLHSCEGDALCFEGGAINITGQTGNVLFHAAFTSGEVQDGEVFLTASSPTSGTALIGAKGFYSSTTLVTPSSPAVVSEAGTAFMLGLGMVGLVGMRKLIA